mgnify:CR=1 FL=1
MSLDELMSDPNYPGLRVCRADLDEYDPYRLPARQPDQISVRFPRPDTPLTGEAVSTLINCLLLETGDLSFLLQENGAPPIGIELN